MPSAVELEWMSFPYQIMKTDKPKSGTYIVGAWFDKYSRLSEADIFFVDLDGVLKNRAGQAINRVPPYWFYLPALHSGTG